MTLRGGNTNTVNVLKQDLLNHVSSYNLPIIKKALEPLKTEDEVNRYKEALIEWYTDNYSDLYGMEFGKFQTVEDFLNFEKRKVEEFIEKYKFNPNTKGFTSFRQFVEYERGKQGNRGRLNNCPTKKPSIRNLKAYQNYMKRCVSGGKRKTKKSKQSKRATRRYR